MKADSLQALLQETRKLLAFHRQCGLGYPLTTEVQSFLAKKGTDLFLKTKNKSVPFLTLDELRQEVENCNLCGHGDTGRMVFAEGRKEPPTPLLIVLDPPGDEEIKAGWTITGEERALLVKMLGAINLSLDQVALTNAIKCAGTGTKQISEKITTCLPHLHRQIEILKPQIICAMGQIATQTLLKSTNSLISLRGRFHDFNSIPVIPTFPPSMLIKHPELKKGAWHDLQMISKKLAQKAPPHQRPSA